MTKSFPKKKRKSNSGSILNTKGKYCMLHGYGNHSTDQCYTVKKRLGQGESSHKYKANDEKYQKARKRDKQEANSIIKRFLKYQNREKSSANKRSLEIKNFENLNLSESEPDDNDKVEDIKVDENADDDDNNSVHSVCSSSSGDTVD